MDEEEENEIDKGVEACVCELQSDFVNRLIGKIKHCITSLTPTLSRKRQRTTPSLKKANEETPNNVTIKFLFLRISTKSLPKIQFPFHELSIVRESNPHVEEQSTHESE